MKTPQAMRDYQHKWRKQHHKQYMLSVQHSTANNYIRNHATLNDLLKFEILVKQRKESLQEGVLNEK